MEAGLLDKSSYNDKVHSIEDTNGDVNQSGDDPVVNGYTNGLEVKAAKKEEHRDKHKDKHKDRHREKERDRDRDKNKDRYKEKSRDKEKERDKDKHRDKEKDHKSSSHKSSSRDKDKERKDKDREKDRDKEKDKERSKDKDKERDKSRDGKERDDKSSHRDKDKSSSSSGSKHHSSSSKSDKDRNKSSSSSTTKDKDRSDKERSDKEKNRDKDKERDKEKDRQREKDKEKSKHSYSSSSKDKEKKDKLSSSDKSKNSHKERTSTSSKDKLDKSHKEKSSPGEKDNTKAKSKTSILDESFEEEPKVNVKEEEPEQEEIKIKDEVKEEVYDNDDDAEDDEEEGDLCIDIKEEPEEDADETYDNTFDESKVKKEELSDDDDIPLSARASKRPPSDFEDDDDIPLAKKKIKKEKESKKKRKKDYESEEEYDDYEEEENFKPKKKKKSVNLKKVKTEDVKIKRETSFNDSPTKKKKKEADHEVWKWWEEEKKDGKTKWNFLEHKGPVFAPPYEPLPPNVKFYYDGKEMRLSEEAEEVATFYARMLEHDYVTREAFNKNFFKDWRKVMTSKEKEHITDLHKCNFKSMHAYFVQKSEERKSRTKDEKKALKEENEQLIEEYGFCTIDGHKEKIGNFRLEPPGLFRGRGEHPKMGMLKRRLTAEDIIINCSKDSDVPKPPEGHRWKEVRHDNTVTWLASWTENVQGQVKYIMLNPSSKLKGEKDWQKYETARKLHKCIDKIRREYKEDWKSKEMRIRQRAVALYFIDKLALRAGNEKDEDQADTVGCCSLRVEHIELHPEKDGKEFVVVFDFLGKDSIRYYNEVPVEKRVFKNLQLFVESKKLGDDLFDRLTTQILNKHLNELMEGLTAKVFRTYNASITLQEQLNLLTDPDYTVPEMILAYNRANRAVAILCNHQRSIPKSHQKSMENLKEKIGSKRDQIDEAEKQYKVAKKDAKNGSAKERIVADKAKKKLEKLKEQLTKLEVQETDKEENKTIALGTSKLNYLDPRISVAWCKKYNIPIDKVYNKTQKSKFRWAIDMAGPDYIF